MTRLWVCLARRDVRDAVRKAVSTYAEDANVLFVDSAAELRTWARDAAPGAHVAVGPLAEGFSSLNVAAAVVRDGRAWEVVLVQPSPDAEFERRAGMLGADAVLDLVAERRDPSDDMDEPAFASDEIPTLVMDATNPRRLESMRALPYVDAGGAVLGGKLAAGPAEGRVPRRPAMPVQAVAEEVLSAPAEVEVAPVADDRIEAESPDVPETRRMARAGTRERAPIIVLVSGRGGVGKTSVLAAMACAAASWGMSVAACDLDLACGNLYSCFGIAGAADLGRLLDVERVDEEALLTCGREAQERIVVWGPCDRPEMADAVAPHAERLLDLLANRHDLVLVDTPTTFTDAVAQAAQQCDRLVLVVDGRPGSSVAQARLGGLAVRLGVARTRIARLANRCGRRAEPTINRADVGLETARPLRVLDGGAEVADCLGEGRVQDLFDLGSKFADSSAESLAKMLGELGCLPDVPEARRLCERRTQRSRWSFGRMREAV